MYKCECCDQEMVKTSSWKLHLKTEKHISNLKIFKEKYKKFRECSKCHSTFVYVKNYNDHRKTCNKILFESIDKPEINVLNDAEPHDKQHHKSNSNEENNLKKGDDKFKEEMSELKEENIKLKEEVKSMNKLKEEVKSINKHKEEISKLKEENLKLKEEVKSMNKLEKEYLELKEEIKESKNENKLLKEELKNQKMKMNHYTKK